MSTQNQDKGYSSGVTDDDDLRPSSSRVKKVLNWDGNKFTMDERHKRELRDHHIKDQAKWAEFENLYEGFPVEDHPLIKSRSCCMGLLLWTVGSIVLLFVFYLLFIIL